MKKQIIMVATLATLLASCSNNEVYEVVNTSGRNNPISFTNLNDKVSRAANDVESDYQVYAKLSTDGQTAWFIDEDITGKGEGKDKPSSGNTYYWPSEGTVTFYSWAPSTITPTAESAFPALLINYTVPSDANEDFTVAAPITQSIGTVNFKFSHMLSKISVSAAVSDALTTAGYSIDFTSATLVVNSNGGALDPTAATPAWTTPNTNATSATYSGAKTYMIIPQTSTACTVQLKGVTIKKGDVTVFSGKDMSIYTIAADDVTGNEFSKGTHYNLKLTVKDTSTDSDGNPIFGGEIKFSAELAADWTTVTPDPGPTQP